jgi:hypothetical protein
MNHYWSREDTQHWIAQLENRVEDIDYYLTQTVAWCEQHDVYSEPTVFACALVTVLWVVTMRGEQLSRREVLEIIGVQDWETARDDMYELGEKYQNSDLEDLLIAVVEHNW